MCLLLENLASFLTKLRIKGQLYLSVSWIKPGVINVWQGFISHVGRDYRIAQVFS